MPDWLLIPGQYFACLFFHAIASFWWRVDQALLLCAVLINYFRQWLQTDILDFTLNLLFQPGNGNALLPFIAGGVMLAVVLGAIFLLLRPLLIHGSPVDFRKIVFWLVLTGWLFGNRGSIFHDLENFRNNLASSAYQTALVINDHIAGSGYNTTNGEVPSPGSGTVTIPQLFPYTTHQYGPDEVTAVDTAAYYLEAEQEDIALQSLGNVPLPDRFYQDYYTTGGVQYFPVPSGNDVRTAAVNRAMAGAGIMFTGIMPAIVAIVQALISLCFALAATALFFSLPIALPFAFFTATEVIAFEILRSYINLLVTTYVVNMILAIFQGFLIFWAGSGNVAAYLAMSVLTLYVSAQFMRVATQKLRQSLIAITTGIGQATGTRLFDPVETVKQGVDRTVKAAVSAGAVIATGGAALPAVAGAVLSSAGYSAGGSALLYGAARNATPGDFARRSLAQRQAAEGGLPPVEQEQAVQAAEVLAGRRAGDPTQARSVLSQLATRADANRAQQAHVHSILSAHGLDSPADEARQQRELETIIGTDLHGANLKPVEIRQALHAIAVIRGSQPGDPAQAQALLQEYGDRATMTRAWQTGIQRELANAQILPPRNSGSHAPGTGGPPPPPPPSSPGEILAGESQPPDGTSGSGAGAVTDTTSPPAAGTSGPSNPTAPPASTTGSSSGGMAPPAGGAAAPGMSGNRPPPRPFLSPLPPSGDDDANFDPLAAMPLEALAAPPADTAAAPVAPSDPDDAGVLAVGTDGLPAEAVDPSPSRRPGSPAVAPSLVGTPSRAPAPTAAPSPVVLAPVALAPADTTPDAARPVVIAVPSDTPPAPATLLPSSADTSPIVVSGAVEAPPPLDAPEPENADPTLDTSSTAPVVPDSEPPPAPDKPGRKKSGRQDSSRFYWMHRKRMNKGGGNS